MNFLNENKANRTLKFIIRNFSEAELYYSMKILPLLLTKYFSNQLKKMKVII